MSTRLLYFLPALCLLAATLTLSACDNPVDDDHDDHAEVHGLLLELNGVEVYRVLEGQVTCAQTPCGITVVEGEETALISVEFLAEDGDHIHGEDLDEAFGLGYEIADPSVAEFEQHDEDGKWRFHIHGEQAGETRMQLQLLHNNHADFTTPPLESADAIVVRVTE